MARQPRDKARAAARRNGSRHEFSVAKKLGGYRHEGQDGDVEARGYRLECKFRTGIPLEEIPNTELANWFQQIERYQNQNPGKPFALAYSGGRASKQGIWIAVPIEEFIRLTDADEDRRMLSGFHTKYPDAVERVSAVLTELARQISNESKKAGL